MSAPILGYPQTGSTFYLDTDASKNGINWCCPLTKQGGVERVIAYGSRSLTKAERNYCATRRELLALVLVYFMRHIRAYLIGRPFVVRTDHVGLHGRYEPQLQELDFSLEHRPGKCHQNADALSRLPCRQCGQSHDGIQVESDAPAEVFAVPSVANSWVLPWTTQELREAQLADPELKSVIEWLEAGKGRPCRSEIQGVGTRLRSLWALWNKLQLSQGSCSDIGMTPVELQVNSCWLYPTVLSPW